MKLTRRDLLKSTSAVAATALVGSKAFAADKEGTLKVLSFGGDAQTTAINHAIERFNKKFPKVKVELAMDPIATGWGDYVTKVLGQFTSGDTADVYGTAIETFQAFASRDLWMPLDDYVKANADFSDFAPSLLEQGSYKGKKLYIPIGWNNIMINCNLDLFAKAGVTKPADWTWDQFREAAKKLTVKDASGNVSQYGYEVPNQNFFVQPWFFSNGTSTLSADWSGSNMLDPKVAESLQFLHDLIHVDGVSPVPGSDTMDNQFVGGQVAMISRGHWIVENCKKANLKMDIANVPSKATPNTVIGFGAYAINKNTKDAELAQALVTELTSVETQKEEGVGGGGVPGRASAAATPEFLAFPPSAALYYASLPHTQPVPSPANFQEVEKIFMRYYTAMMSDAVSIADGCKQAHDELTASFDRLKKQQG
ncbi:extracellular solute-binding protein [Aestuariivirga litoralis]|uniref:extracellular solute-binding protein n=1 Tax=Aestuariivirga litoralis TaxID=2650924 RepID=UPI0018C5C59F|nr:extracellular solute-binding protein [Aestuariivirga litoralis]MBG1233251.1 sugar ABC transporter substrate-binding protein [Aestuariivirga litoralis]